jgi:hypothetical protein
MNLRIPWNVEHFLTTWGPIRFWKTLLYEVKRFHDLASEDIQCVPDSKQAGQGSILAGSCIQQWVAETRGIYRLSPYQDQLCYVNLRTKIKLEGLHILCTDIDNAVKNNKIDNTLIINSFIPQSVLRQVHSHFQSEFSTDCDLVLPLSIPVSSKSDSSWLRLIPRLPVTSDLPSIFTSTTRSRRQFLRKMWPMQLAFLFFLVYIGSSFHPWL